MGGPHAGCNVVQLVAQTSPTLSLLSALRLYLDIIPFLTLRTIFGKPCGSVRLYVYTVVCVYTGVVNLLFEHYYYREIKSH